MAPIVEVSGLVKTYDGGFTALGGVDLSIEDGEIIALLGPNGAGKTTLISAICGLVTPTEGKITVAGFDVVDDWRKARSLIGLVPQEISLEPFATVSQAVRFSRALFGKGDDPARIEAILRELSLWDKRDAQINALSGGMKRRVLIAKALSHEPRVLFLDEPTAGVDVELRKDMWEIVRRLQAEGTTIILTTHYIEEAEAIAERIAVIAKGEILLTDTKADLMRRLGKRELEIHLCDPLDEIPPELAGYDLARPEPTRLVYHFGTHGERTGITRLLQDISAAGLVLKDVQTRQSSLEEIFVGLVSDKEREEDA